MEGRDKMHFSTHFDARKAESSEEPCFDLSRLVQDRLGGPSAVRTVAQSKLSSSVFPSKAP